MKTIKAVVALLVGLLACLSAGADIPLMVNHQGLAKVDGVPFTGNGLFKFGFVAADDTWLWTNDGTQLGVSIGVAPPDATVIVTVNNGIYHVRLGDTTIANMVPIPSSVFDDDDVELRVIFNDGANGEQVLTPDQPLAATPFAYHAANADTVGGKTVADLNLVGEVKMWAGTIAALPPGWLFCDGSAIPRSTYADLFAVIGTIYGNGDGSTTFNLPDFRDRSPMGANRDDAGVPKTEVSGALAQAGGESTHVLTAGEIASHTHQMSAIDNGTQSAVPACLYIQNQLGSNLGIDGGCTTPSSTPMMNQPSGGDQPHNNLHPYFAISFIIKS